MEAMGKLKVEPYRKEALRALGRTMAVIASFRNSWKPG
jgi:hypothetical protein